MDIVQFILANASTFLFVLFRTGSIIFTAPIFGAVNVPMQVKMGLSALIALILTPLTGYVPMPETVLGMTVGLAGEAFIGAAIGLCMKFVFTGIEFAGQVANFQMGIGMASAYDPLNSVQVTVLGKLMSIFTLLMFLSVNGHLMIVMALKKSFEVIPPYGFHFSGALMENIIVFSREIFILAVKFSAPVIAILIFINVALGIMARTVPQLNMFVVGFAITIFAGFVMIALSMPVFETAVTAVFDRMWTGVFNLIRVM
ncbi:MAG: flagellar biosynthetic protein FliR [Deltaproteobacteria bacterium]|nr:flagellar biosynthetic protein FliR [Deltaproteobacteria bacterium]